MSPNSPFLQGGIDLVDCVDDSRNDETDNQRENRKGEQDAAPSSPGNSRTAVLAVKLN